MTTAPALHVAHGRGLPVPTWRVPIGSKNRESSAPPFLRRTPAELAAAETGTAPRIVRTSTPPKPQRSRVKPNPTPKGRYVSPEEVLQMAQEHRDGATLKEIARAHKPISGVRLKRLIAPHVTFRPGGFEPTPIDADQVVKLYTEDGMSLEKMAAHLHIESRRLSQALKDNGVVVTRVRRKS